MTRRTFISAVALIVAFATTAVAADLKVIKSQKSKDLTVRLLNESGQWTEGRNVFVLELTKDGKPIDAGKVMLSTSMAMPGMAPMIAGAELQPESPGRYRGTIQFPDRGERQVTVAWDGPTGKGSTRFPVRVR